jgi:hypothetical protein
MLSLHKRIASATVVAAAAIGLLTATPAAAGTVSARWGCVTQFGPAGQRDFVITLTAPATATRGQPATVTASISEPGNTGQPHPAGAYGGQLEITLGGVGTGVIYANGMTSPEIQPSTPWRLDGQAQLTFSTAGDVTFKPRRIRVWGSPVVPYICSGDTAPIAATTHVS